MCWTLKWLREMATCHPSRCTRPSKGMRLTWPGIRGWTEKVPLPHPAHQRLLVSPQGISLGFIRRPPLSLLQGGQMMRLSPPRDPHHQRITAPRRLNLPLRMTRGCTSLVTLRRRYRMILSCRSEWHAPCRCKR